MEAPEPIIETPKEFKKIFIKDFKLENNQETYVIKVGKTSNETEICFSVSPEKNSFLSFEGKYSLSDLYKLNKSFGFFNSINDLINSFNDMVMNKKILIEKFENDNISLKLGILMSNFIGKEEKVLINLKLNELSEKDINKNLLIKIAELEKKLTEKDEQINSLNNKYKELEKRIEKLENKEKLQFKSDIIYSNDDIDFIIKKLNPNKKNIKLDLIYRCNETNDSPKIFHEKCDGKKNVLVFIETTEGVRFGGFTSIGFNSMTNETIDNEAFLFSIDKKNIYNVKQDRYAIFCSSNYGPCFCGTSSFNICIYGTNILRASCNTSQSRNNSYNINSDYELNNGKYQFSIKFLEIFQVKTY